MRQLEELNLVDNFLANSLTSHKLYGESAARCMLECILGRKIGELRVAPQHFIQGENTDRHGVRLDVYLDEDDGAGELFDLEPDNNDGKEDIASLPKRARFYHSKLDAGSFKTGEKYEKLRNVFVIFIMTYDPFKLDRMVYTIRNGCIEVPDLPYEDGARTIFLFTRGKNGNPPESLRQLLQYMEHTTKENAGTEELRKLHEMVTAVKTDGEVGLAYMKFFELEERTLQKGIRQGRAEGKAEDILDLLCELSEIPPAVREQICSQKDDTILRSWLKLAARAESIQDFEQKAFVIVQSRANLHENMR
ncbi:MAG: PD-(D/E)XK nuclease family transposase [Lachnospiraceae bacterium]|nr:PD-(D/E)XK nuclease family transposase [Lachnospiraceae bacterium]